MLLWAGGGCPRHWLPPAAGRQSRARALEQRWGLQQQEQVRHERSASAQGRPGPQHYVLAVESWGEVETGRRALATLRLHCVWRSGTHHPRLGLPEINAVCPPCGVHLGCAGRAISRLAAQFQASQSPGRCRGSMTPSFISPAGVTNPFVARGVREAAARPVKRYTGEWDGAGGAGQRMAAPSRPTPLCRRHCRCRWQPCQPQSTPRCFVQGCPPSTALRTTCWRPPSLSLSL